MLNPAVGLPRYFLHSRAVSLGCLLYLATGCGGPAPILYPNAHLASVGDRAAKDDVENCRETAEAAGARDGTGQGGQVATNTAVGAGAGAAGGAVGGAISGGVGIGAMIGAASGAVWGLLTGLFNTRTSQPSQAYVNFVNRCLADKGYEVSGWQ